MPKQPYIQGRSRPRGNAALGRAESGNEEERPFAEIRKSLHDILRMLLLHRWAFFVPFSVVTCAAFILSLYYPRTYSATTTFERRNDPVMANLPMSAGAASFKYFRNTMVRDLTSRECLSEVIEKLGMTREFERNEDGTLTRASQRRSDSLARRLGRTLSISTTSPSEQIDIIKITYTGPDPTIGAKLVDQVKKTYIRRTMAWIHEFLRSQRDYFKAEGVEILAQLRAAQREETRFRLENPLADPANPGTITLELAQREMERRELLLRQREYESEFDSLRQQLVAVESQFRVPSRSNKAVSAPPQAPVASARAIHLQEEIVTIDDQISSLKELRGMTDLHPDIQQQLTRRLSLERDLNAQRLRDRMTLAARPTPTDPAQASPEPVAEPVPTWSPERARLNAQLAVTQAKLKDIGIGLETNQLALKQLGQAKRDVYDKQEEFADAVGHVAQTRHRYRQVEQTLANIEPAIKAVEQNRLLQFSEGQPARGSTIPVSPSANTVVLLALLAGIASGAVFVVLAEVFDHVYRSSSQVAKSLGLPMLESIDEIVTGQDRRARFFKRMVLSPVVVCCFAALTGLTGSMAYLSIQQPWTYQKIRRIPEAALELFAVSASATQESATPSPGS